MDKLIEVVNDLIKKEEIEWETIINELINKGVIDPENIDLDILIDYFIGIIRELKKKENFDFILSSKALFLLAYFLKLKIEYLAREYFYSSYNEEEFFYDDYEEDKENNKQEKKKKTIKKELKLKILYERKRKVTFDDLKEAIKEILEKEEKKRQKRKIKKENLNDLATMEYDIEKETELILKALEQYEKNEISFFELLKKLLSVFNKEKVNIKEEIVKKFIPLLYLDFQEKIEIFQKKLFGDIFIKKLLESKEKEIQEN